MKKRFFILWLAVLLLLTGCSSLRKLAPTISNDGIPETAILYFGNQDGTDLIAESLDIKDKDPEVVPAYIMEKLLDGPTNPNLTRAVRAGTRLLAIQAEGSQVNVDLSKEFYHETSIYDVLAQAAIVKSICSVRVYDRVMITIEGKPMETADGTPIGVLKETDVVFDADTLMTDETDITLYFSDMNAEYLVREVRRVRVPRGESVEKLVVSELIKGPKNANSGRTMPAETKIRSVETKDKVCFVNLSSEFVSKNNVGSSAEQLTIYSIVNSLTELSNVDKVQFLIEGEKKEVYHHMIFNEPIERNVTMIQK
ncbi:MAG: GerMN domain-containing protein [Clostridia bacterium]|nr:GerMN domain-containing protein [Clostridia bacterium]